MENYLFCKSDKAQSELYLSGFNLITLVCVLYSYQFIEFSRQFNLEKMLKHAK